MSYLFFQRGAPQRTVYKSTKLIREFDFFNLDRDRIWVQAAYAPFIYANKYTAKHQ